MNNQSTNNKKTTEELHMQQLNNSQLGDIAMLVKKFNFEEMKACLEAGSNLSKLDTLEASVEKFSRQFRADFGVLGNMMSGSKAHYSLNEKLNLLTKSEKEFFVLICHQYSHGDEDIIHNISDMVNEHCKDVDLWPAEQINISGSCNVILEFKPFVSSVCNDVCIDTYTIFSIPSTAHNSKVSVDILRQMIEGLGYQVLDISPVEKCNHADNNTTQVNYIIDTTLPPHIYFSLMSEEAA